MSAMTIIEPLSSGLDLDELAKLEIEIARRADELKRIVGPADSGRDFWSEAESEIWSARIQSLEPHPTG